MTRADLATKTGIPYKTLGHYEVFRRKIPPQSVTILARALEIHEPDLTATGADPVERAQERRLLDIVRHLGPDDREQVIKIASTFRDRAA